MRIAVLGVVALAMLTAACGSDTSQRSATGGLTGIGVGAAVGGPVGAVVGGVVGAGGGALAPEGADEAAENALHPQRAAAERDRVRQAQTELQRQGLYDGPIDGIAGPKTRQALSAFQQRQGLQQTAKLDPQTLQRLGVAQNTGNAAVASGSSTPELSPSQLRGKLQQQGYANVTGLTRNPDNSWSARAQRGDQTLALRVDAHSGRVLDEQNVAAGSAPANASPSPASGSSTPPSAGTGASTPGTNPNH